MAITDRDITSCLESVIDPELGINIVELGLIYNIQIDEKKISIDMTLTNPGCPFAATLAGNVEQVVREKFEGIEVEVSFVWDPPWTLDRMSEAAKKHLGYDC